MRTLMTLLTLGAAGAGYVYLQQTPVAGESYLDKVTAPSLFDWNHDNHSTVDASRYPVKDLVGRIHEHTRSVLDDFANQNGENSEATVDDAFQRLRLVAQSVATSPSNTHESSIRDESTKPARVPPPDLDELHRTAFDPTADFDPASKPTNHPESERAVEKRDPVAVEKPAATQTVTGTLEPTRTLDRSNSVPANEPSQVDVSASRISQIGTKRTSNREEKKVTAEWKVVGKSTEGRPMHSMHLGDTGTRTLVIAGLNGTDRTAVRWLELLAEELSRRPALLKNNEVVFFRAGNPDGLVRNVRNNARAVPLNRNFPSRRYRPTTDIPAFAAPASEVETRVILDTLYTFRPRRVIHLTSTTGRSQILHNRSAVRIATELERSAKLNLLPLDAEQHPGSVEDFADGTLEAAVLSMRLSAEDDWQKAWTALQLPVLSAVVGQAIEAPAEDAMQAADPDRSPIPPVVIEPDPRRPRRGYEELPPPPPL